MNRHIIIVDDEWGLPLVQDFYHSLQHKFGKPNVSYINTIADLKKRLKKYREGRDTGTFGLVLDIMFGHGGNIDGLTHLLLDSDWGSYLAANKVPIIVLTNYSLEDFKKHAVYAQVYKDENGSYTFSEEIVVVRSKRDMAKGDDLLNDLVSEIFSKVI